MVLAGGGAFGAYGLGVMRALFNGRWKYGTEGVVRPTIFSGTSVGAFNAAVMVAACNSNPLDAVRQTQEIWLDRIAHDFHHPNGVFRLRGNPREYLRTSQSLAHDLRVLAEHWIQRSFSVGLSKDPRLTKLLRLFDLNDLVSALPLKRLVAEVIAPERILRRSAHTLRLITTEWNSGRALVFTNRFDTRPARQPTEFNLVPINPTNLHAAILGSAAVPGFLPPVHLDSKILVDGGVLLNAPLQPAINAGASVLHVIHLRPEPLPIPLGRSGSAWESLERIMVTVPSALLDKSMWVLRRQEKSRQVAQVMARWLGKGSSPPAGSSDHELLETVAKKVLARQPLTIHRYAPGQLTTRLQGMWNFNRDWLIELIEMGFTDAVEHDCETSGCLIPDG